MAILDPAVLADPVALTRALVDIESVSGNEREIADAVESALSATELSVRRIGNTVAARTDLDRPQRVVLAGHLDTVPLADNFPSTLDGGLMFGCGTSDMKSGTALALHLAATLAEPRVCVHRPVSGDLANPSRYRFCVADHRAWLSIRLQVVQPCRLRKNAPPQKGGVGSR